ncbi:hypothetical protein A2U01_0072511, partial [Trifolium medium]|nr:hypothetical protein [Trifolium medium]
MDKPNCSELPSLSDTVDEVSEYIIGTASARGGDDKSLENKDP